MIIFHKIQKETESFLYYVNLGHIVDNVLESNI